MAALRDIPILERAPIPTWFRVGGGADRLARPADADDVRRCLQIDPAARVLGQGANLLVDDAGVGELVLDMTAPGMATFDVDLRLARVTARAGADLARLVTESVRRGLAGLEGLGGIPATIGGAVMMNAGGAFGEIKDAVARVFALDRAASEVILDRPAIDFGYRRSGLSNLVITAVELALTPADPAALRTRLKEVMAYKKSSQPLAADSAGCCFKNPTLSEAVWGVGEAGQRVSAGLVIDRAGLKGLRAGGARVSEVHANFLVTDRGALARDVINLMGEVERRVLDTFGIRLEREVVVWERTPRRGDAP
jgi:UDP-N-acetylmuramate dehydrogenase